MEKFIHTTEACETCPVTDYLCHDKGACYIESMQDEKEARTINDVHNNDDVIDAYWILQNYIDELKNYDVQARLAHALQILYNETVDIS